jgi:hypothetical protein
MTSGAPRDGSSLSANVPEHANEADRAPGLDVFCVTSQDPETPRRFGADVGRR